MYCKKCGESLMGAKYCVHCGTKHTSESGALYESIAVSDRANGCQRCGTALEEWYSYCPYCGTRAGSSEGSGVGSAPNETIGFWTAMVNFWRFFGVWSGRTTRREFWYGVLCWDLIALVVLIPLMVLLTLHVPTLGNAVTYAVGAAVNLASAAAMSRRLHDTGRTAHNLWLLLIPLVGLVVLYIFLAAPSHPNGEAFGPYITRENQNEYARWNAKSN